MIVSLNRVSDLPLGSHDPGMAEGQAQQDRTDKSDRQQERDSAGDKHGQQWMRVRKLLVFVARSGVQLN